MEDINNKFRKDNGTIDWNQLLYHIWENKSNGRTMKEWAKLYGVHNVTLSHKYTGFLAHAALFNENGANFASSLVNRELNIMKNSAKLVIQRREINKQIRQKALEELIIEDLLIPNIKPYVPQSYRRKENNNTKQLFFISDLHFKDKKVSKGLNDIGRMVIDSWDKSQTIKLVFGGDYIEGRHHRDQQLKTSEESGQAIDVAEIISKQIAFIMANTKAKVEVYFLIGNHDEGRSGGDKAQENLKDHYVKIIQKVVQLALKDYQYFSIIKEPSYEVSIKLGTKNINFRHGHIGHWAYKSLEQNILKEELQLNRSFDHYVFGHYHKFSDWIIKGVDKRFTTAPSFKTYDGNFENSKLLRNTTGILVFYENGSMEYLPWEGKKIIEGELK